MGEMKKLWNKLFNEKTLDKMIKYTTYECQRKMLVTFAATSGEAFAAAIGDAVTEKSLIEKYWNNHIKNNFPSKSLVKKESPLTATNSKKCEEFAVGNNLQSAVSDFSSDSGLFCNVDHIFGEAFFYHQNHMPKYEVMENETVMVSFPGSFFREKLLKQGTVMMMGEIRDITPERSFLPRSVASKLPFSSSKMGEMKKLWKKKFDEKTLEKMIKYTTYECERKPNRDKIKMCVSSMEDMVDLQHLFLEQ